MTWLLDSLGAFLNSNGKYDEVISYYKQALEIYDREFGVDHIRSAETSHYLGTICYSQGKSNEAISYREMALKCERESSMKPIAAAECALCPKVNVRIIET